MTLSVDLNAGTVTADGDSNSNYAVNTADPMHGCGVTINAVTEDHLGEWKCFMNENVANQPSITGTFQLMEAVEGAYLKDGLRYVRSTISKCMVQ